MAADIREQQCILAQHPEVVVRLGPKFDEWWKDIQPYPLNDDLKDVPETLMPFHDLYRQQLGQKRFDAAMRAITGTHERPLKTRH